MRPKGGSCSISSSGFEEVEWMGRSLKRVVKPTDTGSAITKETQEKERAICDIWIS